MDFSFLRNWFSAAGTSIDSKSSKSNNAEQPNPIPIDNDKFEIIEDYEFINPADPNEPHSLPSSYQIDESIVKIAGFNKEKLLEMSNFCKISYGDNDDQLSKESYKALVCDDDLLNGNKEKMHKTRAELESEGYKIIQFGNSFEKDAGHVFIKDKEITIAYHGTRLKHGPWGLNDVMTDLNGSFITSELLPDGGRIHRGFYNSFTDSWPNLYDVLKSHAEKQGSEIKDFKINLTGHSMGGAVAKIAALCLNKTEGAEDLHVATFGDPRVFDLTASEVYNEALQGKTIRVTQHRQDIVPALSPGLFGYAHVGAQLRVSVPEGYWFHQIDGYHEAIYKTDKRDFWSNNDVSLFYCPIRKLNHINSKTLGNAQYYAANTWSYISGGSNFFEEVKNDYERDKPELIDWTDVNNSACQLEQIKVEKSKTAHKNSSSIAIGG